MENPASLRHDERSVSTSHVREMAANLVLGRALNMLDGACGMVVFWDAEGRWNRDSFALPGQPDVVTELGPVLEALVEWTLYTEQPVLVDDLARSRWSRFLLSDRLPPSGSIAATPLAQRGAIWGALALYRSAPARDRVLLLQELAELATEPLSALGAGRPEGVNS